MFDKIAALRKIAVVELYKKDWTLPRPTTNTGKAFQAAMNPFGSMIQAGRNVIDRFQNNQQNISSKQNVPSPGGYAKSFINRYLEDPTKFKESMGIPQVRQITPYESIPKWQRDLSKGSLKNLSNSSIDALNGGSVWPAWAQAKALRGNSIM